ncbi:MAG: hypothetical protein K9M11_00165 [Candidatus Pacebacteria bacterium]|nr:hypothetical protein [Candidatus Paceibacterota bacterium]
MKKNKNNFEELFKKRRKEADLRMKEMRADTKRFVAKINEILLRNKIRREAGEERIIEY